MAGSTGFEPATSGLTVQCANQAAPRARARSRYTGRRRFVHRTPSERAAAPPAHAPARRAAGEAAAAALAAAAVSVAPARRENRFLRPAREGGQVMRERGQREVTPAVIPGRRRDLEALEVEDPPLG